MITQKLSGPVLRESLKPSETDLAKIKELKNPPLVELTPEDIHIRKVRLAGDFIDEYGGCFRSEDLAKLLKMTAGAPLLIGHRKDTVGVARFFDGSVEKFGNGNYIIPKFYWLKAHSQAEDLRIQIDGGIICEASISFVYTRPTCSVCGEDIRACPHSVGKLYMGSTESCFYYYDGLKRVNEGSLVYRGAEPGTGIELTARKSYPAPNDKLYVRVHGRLYAANPIS
ncbi:hypothetical protein ISS30_01715 [bacterium]|nr:hypothetical protein [FCB group bacterium]MBL7190383.1 hypothetical protein [bacterium]